MTDQPVSLLWYSSRSQIEDGRSFCARARYLTGHCGPNGYGIVRRGQSLPLATGGMQHTAQRGVLAWARDHDPEILRALEEPETYTGPARILVPRAIVRAAIQKAWGEYDLMVEARGFAYDADNPEVAYLVQEQKTLIASLCWAWTIEALPPILEHSRILEVERDEAVVYECSCGLGAFIGHHDDHVLRGCTGKALPNMPDFISQRRDTQGLGYHEFKTTGSDQPSFRDQWEVKMQLIATTTEVELRIGQPVVEIYVHGLLKGKREQEYNYESRRKDSGVFTQASRCCYGYFKPAAPPMESGDLKPSYEYWDEYEQKIKRVGKGFQKVPVWQLGELGALPIPEGWMVEEAWMEFCGPDARRKVLCVLGPFSKQEQMVTGFFEEARGEEDRWQAGLWELADLTMELMREHTGNHAAVGTVDYWQIVWADERFQAAINRLFPRSYACRRYGKRYACQYERLCFYREGWDYPLTASVLDETNPGAFILRRPHHKQELAQAVARGLLPPDDFGLVDDTEEGW